MNNKLAYAFSLVSFLLIWGVLGMVVAPSHTGSALQATEPAVATAVPTTNVPRIPVTGEAQPEPLLIEIIVFYGLIGITAMFLILALLNLANRSSVPSREREPRVTGDSRKN